MWATHIRHLTIKGMRTQERRHLNIKAYGHMVRRHLTIKEIRTQRETFFYGRTNCNIHYLNFKGSNVGLNHMSKLERMCRNVSSQQLVCVVVEFLSRARADPHA